MSLNSKCYDLQYMIITSSGKNSNSLSKKEDNKQKTININHKGDLPGVNYDSFLIQNELFNVNEPKDYSLSFNGLYYFHNKSIDDKIFFKNKISDLFNNKAKATVLFLSGHGDIDYKNNKSYFKLESKKKNDKIFYSDIVDLWKNRSFPLVNTDLLIVIDACHSGGWVKENIDNFHLDIMIQASCQWNQISIDRYDYYIKGGLFMHNLTKLNNGHIRHIDISDNDQKPSSSVFYFSALNKFKIKIGFNDWSEMPIYNNRTLEYSNGKYVGCCNSILYFFSKVKEGKGIFYWNDNSRYEGDWKNDLKEGRGILYYSNGDIYKGEWKKDMKEGKGVYYWKSGEIYEGEWKNDEKEGKGTYYWTNGDKYIGNWKNGNKVK